jgi:hypothetical protein
MYRLRAICLDVSSSRDLSQCAAFMRFVSLYHIRAICFIILHSNDLFRYIAFERFILFVHEISVLYVGDVFLNIVPLFHHRSFEPISRVRVETSFVLWPPLQKKPSGDITVQWCVVIPLVGARSITTHNCAATSLAGLLNCRVVSI